MRGITFNNHINSFDIGEIHRRSRVNQEDQGGDGGNDTEGLHLKRNNRNNHSFLHLVCRYW